MNKLHNQSNNDNLVPKEGQPDLLCSNKKSCGCPSLGYEAIISEEKLNKAFDILFDKVLKTTT